MTSAYILYSKSTKKFYTGSSRTTAKNRLLAHNAGRTKSTKSGRPWKLIFEEPHATYAEAQRREKFLKSGMGRKWVIEKFGSLKT